MRLDRMLPNHIELPAPPASIDLTRFPTHGSVYALTDASDQLIQLSASEDLRRAIGTRLCTGEEDRKRRRADLRAVTRHVRYVSTFSQFETMFVFHRWARQLMPRAYRDQIAFGPAWFAQVNPDDALPRFAATSSPFEKPGTAIGPFHGRNVCARFIELIEDLFDLCRHYDILQKTPDGQPCAYFEMGKCPAPCDGSIPLSRYRRMVSSAAAFAAGQREPFRQDLRDQMQQAAEKLEFERAAVLKQALERTDKVEAKSYRLARPAEFFSFLIVQRAGGRSRVKPFYVHRGNITPGREVTGKHLEAAARRWVRRATAETHRERPVDPVYRAEQAWLVSHFLFKQDHVPGLYLAAETLPDPPRLADLMRETFKLSGGRKSPTAHRDVDENAPDLTVRSASDRTRDAAR